MAGKRKVHTKTDLSVPMVERDPDAGRALSNYPPEVTIVEFPPHPSTERKFDFAPFYGVGIDEITYACQRQIERFLAKQDADLEVSTISYCTTKGLRTFLGYLSLRATALDRSLTLHDIDRDVIDGLIGYLRASGVSLSTQATRYAVIKTVLVSLGRRGLILIVANGDDQTFPRNPFPVPTRNFKGEQPLTRKERNAFAAAVKTAAMPLFNPNVNVTCELLGYALLIVALHTGRNTTPLVEMTTDCLLPHPRKNTHLLVLWKRRGHNTSKVILKQDTDPERTLESLSGLRYPVARLINRIIELTRPLRDEVPPRLAKRLWLYRSQEKKTYGNVKALTVNRVNQLTGRLVQVASLVDADGRPLRLNISRLRKTFANRIFELLNGDLAGTAIALGNTPQVAERNYLAPTEDSIRNWKFLGETLTQELLSRTLGATERTPVGRCTDPNGGQYAPKKQPGATCFSFLDCVRCRNYVVTGDDLYRLYSFYWRVLRERDRMDALTWKKHYAHIPRIIQRDIVEKGLKRQIFNATDVENAKNSARIHPHPFWSYDSISQLEPFRDLPEDNA